MIETTTIRPVTDGSAEVSTYAVTWSAIIAGAVAAAAATLALLILGAGLGLTAVSPWANSMSATTLGVGALIWLIVTQWVSAGLGGYLTGRLRTRWVNAHTHEVFFRDTAHGFLTWALATVLAAALLTSAVSSIVGGTTTAASTVLSGAAQGATQGAAQLTANWMSDSSAYFVDTLFRTDKPATAGNLQDIRAESSRILVTAFGEGDMPPADKARLAQLVASQTGLSQADAEKRVDDVVVQAKAAAAKVKAAADKARKAASSLALFSFLSLLIGAFIASTAAAFGGHERDEHDRMYTVEKRVM